MYKYLLGIIIAIILIYIAYKYLAKEGYVRFGNSEGYLRLHEGYIVLDDAKPLEPYLGAPTWTNFYPIPRNVGIKSQAVATWDQGSRGIPGRTIMGDWEVQTGKLNDPLFSGV
jgi:hypothetical protein